MNKLFHLIITALFLSACSTLTLQETNSTGITLETRNAVAEKIPREFYEGTPVRSDRTLVVICPDNNDPQWFVISEMEIIHLANPPAAGRHIDKLMASGGGKYLAILSADEGHPELTIVDLPALLADRKTGYLHHINPYPGFVDITEWKGKYIFMTSNRPLNEKDLRVRDLSDEDETFPLTPFALDVESGAVIPNP